MKQLLTLILLVGALPAAQWPADSVYNRAMSCVRVEWTPTAANTDPWFFTTYGSTCTGANEIYLKCDFLTGVTYRSIAYSYGGEDNHDEFSDKLSRDYLVGSHLCHYQSYGDPSDTIAGTDCSGFLSYCWKVPRQSTSMFINNSAYEKIQWSDLKGGDALVKAGSHAVLVLDGSNPAATLIVESTSAVNGVRKRLIDVNSEYWQLYTPLRNPNITGTIGVIAQSKVTENPSLFTKKGNHLQLHQKAQRVTLYSVLGRELFSWQGQQQIQLPEMSGIFFLSIEMGGATHQVKIQL